jgi:outer membrane protein assembly factor BamB
MIWIERSRLPFCVGLVLWAGLAGAQDWSQWRGPDRTGQAGVALERASWPAALQQVWKVEVGIGHSSPVVAGERVLQLARRGEREVLAALDLSTGQTVWSDGYDAPYTMSSAARRHGKGPKSTPVVHGGQVCAFGISGILSCYEVSTGSLSWRRDFSARFRATAPLYGVAMSPLVDGGLLIVHVGGHDDGALEAYDLRDGAERWSWSGDGPGYASPVVAVIAGVRQVITQSQRHLVGVAVSDGSLLWKLPFATAWDQNAVTCVVDGDVIIYSGLDNGVHAVRVARRGGDWRLEPAWENDDVSAYMSSPVLSEGRLFGLSHHSRGQFFCLDARSGRMLWASRGRSGENASLVDAGAVLLLLTTDAELVVVRKQADAFTPLATYTVADTPVWAHLAAVPGGLLVKDLEHLTLWRLE